VQSPDADAKISACLGFLQKQVEQTQMQVACGKWRWQKTRHLVATLRAREIERERERERESRLVIQTTQLCKHNKNAPQKLARIVESPLSKAVFSSHIIHSRR
jgi:hypothetical protein